MKEEGNFNAHSVRIELLTKAEIVLCVPLNLYRLAQLTMETVVAWAVVCLAGLTAGASYPVYPPKRYGSLVPLGPRIYYEPDPVDLYYQPEVAYRLPPLYYDYQPYYEESEDEREEDPYGDTGKLFLQNLILSQMYQDAVSRAYGRPRQEDYDDAGYVYGEQVDEPARYREDEDVKELKSLNKPSAFRENTRRSYYPDNRWTPSKRAVTTAAPQGQREEVLPRPASPPRPQRFYQPSPYDSLKRLLRLQDKLQQEPGLPKAKTQKRSYVPSEQSLVQQLGNLKKSA